MKIISVAGCPYEDHEGEILDINISLEDGEVFYAGGMIPIEMMDGNVLESEIKIINPEVPGDYAVISNKAREWKSSGKTLKEAIGPGNFTIVVMNVPYHEVKTDEEIAARAFFEEHRKKKCVSPFKELRCGEESIYDYVKEGYTVPAKVVAYLQTTKPYLMSPGVYEHPFIKGKRLFGPYKFTDGYYWWDRDTWKYVTKYNVTLPQEFIDHVMSEEGTKFLEQREKEGDSWHGIIAKWKNSEKGGLCLLPDDAGDIGLDDF